MKYHLGQTIRLKDGVTGKIVRVIERGEHVTYHLRVPTKTIIECDERFVAGVVPASKAQPTL